MFGGLHLYLNLFFDLTTAVKTGEVCNPRIDTCPSQFAS